MCACVYMSVCVKIIRNWLTGLWRMHSPKNCRWQAGNPGEPSVFLSESKGQSSRNGGVSSGSKAGRLETKKDQCFSSSLKEEIKLMS